ncbi:MAG: lasso peptide biosynthesis B2 protein [Thermodesulfobacteriota bacterium]
MFIIVFRLIGYRNSKIIIDKLIISIIRDEQTSSNIVIHESKIINYATGISIIRPTCLERSLYSYLILGLYGIKCDLKIGINNSTEEFSAHAWIVYKDKAINDNINNLKNFSTF